MHTSVKMFFPKFSEILEGNVTWMYLDVKGLVTTGKGNLIDPVGNALQLEFEYRSTPGIIADAAAVKKEWNYIKTRTFRTPLEPLDSILVIF